jgi:UDP-glucose 4-epimerase
MRIVITGATGYLGARLCRNLCVSGHEVIAVYRTLESKYTAWKEDLFSVIEGDIRESETIKKIAETGADALVHLVSLDHRASEADPVLVNEVNVLPTWRLLDACSKNGFKKFIYFSTMQVYGRIPNTVIDESYPIATANVYALTHLLSEQIVEHFNKNTEMNAISVRLSNSYGVPVFHENNCWWLAINDLCKSAIERKEIKLLSDGSPQRDFIHGNDVSDAIEVLLTKAEKQENNIYNLVSGITLTIMELALIIKAEYFKRYKIEIPIFTPEGIYNESEFTKSIEKYRISNEKFSGLGFEAQVKIGEGIQEVFSYLESK